jgi:uncharacterized protein YggU (UPF0235/DUF167 family)
MDRPEATADLVIAEGASAARFTVRVIPRAAHEGVQGVRDGRLLLRVNAPPAGGAANDAAIRLVAKTLALPRSAVRLVTGHTARNKLIEVSGLRGSDVRARLRRSS